MRPMSDKPENGDMRVQRHESPHRAPETGVARPRAVIAGGSGFLGSHLCDRLLAEGFEVLCLDNLLTSEAENISHLRSVPGFTFMECDVTQPISIPGPVDYVLHFASPASPEDYLRFPLQTLAVGSVGTRNLLDLAKVKGATFLLASTSEIYGDPEIHPQPETYRGSVNSIGPRACYDEGKRSAETMFFDYYRQYGTAIKVARISVADSKRSFRFCAIPRLKMDATAALTCGAIAWAGCNGSGCPLTIAPARLSASGGRTFVSRW